MGEQWYIVGPLAKGDQRLAQRAKGGPWYLLDNSGPTPDHTDDGPLRVDRSRAVKIGKDYCSVPVICERDDSTSWVVVTHKGMLAMPKEAIGRMDVEPELGPLWALLSSL